MRDEINAPLVGRSFAALGKANLGVRLPSPLHDRWARLVATRAILLDKLDASNDE